MKVSVLFTKQRSLGSYIIRLVTWSNYSHVEILLPDMNLKDDFLFSSTAKDGVGYTRLSERLHKSSKAVIMEIDSDNFNFPLLLKFIESNMWKKYDWLGVIGIGLKRDWQSNNRWFCSEIVASALKYAGVQLFDSGFYGRITPQDLYKLNYPKKRIK